MTKKSKPIIKLTFKSAISMIGAVFIFVLLLKNASLSSNAVSNALQMCAKMLIPSLFPLVVASEIMTNTGAIEKLTYKLSKPISKILGVHKNATAPYFLGLLGGYTSSCKSAVILYKSSKISKEDCESIIAMSNMPSIAFMTGFVGTGIFKNSTIGCILCLINILSSLILGIINNIFFKHKTKVYISTNENLKNSNNFFKSFVNAIAHAAHSMLIICACVVFFFVLIEVLKLYLNEIYMPEQIKNILLGMLEITKGISTSITIQDVSLRAIACAFLIGWSGLCVHFQVIALCEDTDISFKKYFIFKGLQGIICTILAWIIFNLI